MLAFKGPAVHLKASLISLREERKKNYGVTWHGIAVCSKFSEPVAEIYWHYAVKFQNW